MWNSFSNIGRVPSKEKYQVHSSKVSLKGPSMLAGLSQIPQTRYHEVSLRSFVSSLNLNNRLFHAAQSWLGQTWRCFVPSSLLLHMLLQALPLLPNTCHFFTQSAAVCPPGLTRRFLVF